jgi:hypothetical protein
MAKLRKQRRQRDAGSTTADFAVGGVIGFAIFISTVPLMTICLILLGIIFTHLVIPKASIFSEAAYSDTPPQVYFVDFSATRLTTLASWASSLSSYLPSALMVLVSIPVARILRENSNVNDGDSLPTPFQFSLLLQLLSGETWSLWGWRRTRQGTNRNPLRILNLIGILFLFSLFLRWDFFFPHASPSREIILRPDI